MDGLCGLVTLGRGLRGVLLELESHRFPYIYRLPADGGALLARNFQCSLNTSCAGNT